MDNISRDIMTVFKDYDESVEVNKFRTIESIPLGGKLYYWWFGKGVETRKKEKKKQKKKTKGTTILPPPIPK